MQPTIICACVPVEYPGHDEITALANATESNNAHYGDVQQAMSREEM